MIDVNGCYRWFPPEFSRCCCIFWTYFNRGPPEVFVSLTFRNRFIIVYLLLAGVGGGFFTAQTKQTMRRRLQQQQAATTFCCTAINYCFIAEHDKIVANSSWRYELTIKLFNISHLWFTNLTEPLCERRELKESGNFSQNKILTRRLHWSSFQFCFKIFVKISIYK